MKTIRIENNFARVCPGLKIGIIGAQVTNTETDPRLWEQIDDEASRIAAAYKIDEINKRPAIQATRKAYRSFGKDPNRYRVSSEALCRRIIRGLGIYRIDTLVDLINLVSVRSGYSIGAFDADRIEGDTLVLGVGKEGEIFRGIGRGVLNIEGLPVYRDDKGGQCLWRRNASRRNHNLHNGAATAIRFCREYPHRHSFGRPFHRLRSSTSVKDSAAFP